MNANDIQKKIEMEIKNAMVYVSGDDNTHYQVMVVSDSFEDKTRVEQQKMVYQALNDDIQSGDIHAIELKTYTHANWNTKKK